MSFIGDVISSITSPILGKPDHSDVNAATSATTNATNALSGMSQDFYNKTQGLRGGVIDRLVNFMKGNLDPTQSAQYAPIKMTAERQYQTAMDELMEKKANGGALYEGMANLGGQKAASITDAISKIIADEYNKAVAMSTGSQSAAAQGMSNAANAGGNLLNALSNQSQAGSTAAGNIGNIIKWLLEE